MWIIWLSLYPSLAKDLEPWTIVQQACIAIFSPSVYSTRHISQFLFNEQYVVYSELVAVAKQLRCRTMFYAIVRVEFMVVARLDKRCPC